MRKFLCLLSVFCCIYLTIGCEFNNNKNFTGWEFITLEGVGSFRLPDGWSMEQTDGFLTGYDENGNAIMLEITEESVYGDYESLDEYGEVFSAGGYYTKNEYHVDNTNIELFAVTFDTDVTESEPLGGSFSFVFLNPDIDEELVRKIAMSYEMEVLS